MPTIRVSDKNFDILKTFAEPLMDKPDDALGKVLSLALQHRDKCVTKGHSTSRIAKMKPVGAVPQTAQKRLSPGALAPMGVYQSPLLEALYELGGSGKVGQVLPIIEKKVKADLTSADYTRNNSGTIRWQNRVEWMKSQLKRDGLIRDGQRGVWELTPAGVAEIEQHR